MYFNRLKSIGKNKIPENIFLLKSQDTGGQTSHVFPFLLPPIQHPTSVPPHTLLTMMKLAVLAALAGSACAFAPATNGNNIR